MSGTHILKAGNNEMMFTLLYVGLTFSMIPRIAICIELYLSSWYKVIGSNTPIPGSSSWPQVLTLSIDKLFKQLD